MEKMWLRSLIVALACLAVVACGKSKDGSSSVSAAPADAKVPTTTADQKPEEKNGNKDMKGNPIVDHKDSKKPHGAQEKGGKPDNSQTPPANNNNNGSGNGGGNSSTQPPVQTSPPQNDKSTKPAPAPKDLGSLLAEAERYSGSASDGLRDLLIMKAMSQSEDQKLRSAKFASTIQKARLILNNNIDKVEMILTIGKNDVGFIGSFKNGKVVDFASNAEGFSGTLTCMDQLISDKQTCETSVAEVKYNDSATVQIIFRTTSVSMRMIFPPQNCMTQACEDFYNLSRYSERRIADNNTLKVLKLESSEVIMGKSQFSFVMVSHENQVMRISGPLSNPAMYPTLDTPTDRSLAPSDLRDPSTGEARQTRMNQALNDVRLVLNDGQGHLNFLVKMKMQPNGKADTFQIRLERQVRPIDLPADLTRTAGN